MAVWLAQTLRPRRGHALAGWATQHLALRPDIARIAPLAHESGLSARRFGQVFREEVGLSPKRFARLLRFRSVIDRIAAGRGVDSAQLAAECGFHDQPHLNREFRAFTGLTPGAYVAAAGPHPNHVPLA